MTNVAEKFPDREAPTAPHEDVPSQTLIRVARIEALAERATTTLLAEGDTDTARDVFADLAEIRALAGRVLR